MNDTANDKPVEPSASNAAGDETHPNESLMIDIDAVTDLVPVGRRTIERMVAIGKFPKPLNIQCRRRFWYRPTIVSWIEKLDRAAQGLES